MMGWLRSQRWWATRVLALPLHLLAFAVVAFFLVAAMPGDPVEALTGGQVTPANYAAIKHSLGLDQNLFDQLLHFLHQMITFNFGISISSGRPVSAEFATRLPATVELALLAIAGVIVVSFGCALLMIARPGNPLSRLLRLYARTAGALPEYCLAVGGIFLFYSILHWAPAPDGLLSPAVTAPPAVTGLPLLDAILGNDGPAFRSEVQHLALPVIVLVAANVPVVLRLLVHQLEVVAVDPATRFRAASGASLADGGREHVPAGAAEHRDDARRGVRLPARRGRDHGGPLRPRGDGAVRHRRGELLRRGGRAQLPDGGRGPLAHRLPARRHHQHDSRPAPASRRADGGSVMAAVTTIARPKPQPEPRWRRHAATGSGRLWWLGLAPVAVLAVVAIIGPWITPYSPTRVVGPTSVPPDGRYWFGTDSNGLDVFSRVLAATRVNMEIAVAVVVLATAGGIALGLLVGMNESRRGLLGVLARGLARLIDLVQAVPAVLIGLVLVAFYGGNLPTLIAAISIVLLPIQMRLVRVEVLRVRGEAFVDAARMAGMSEFGLTVRTVLPNSTRAALENVSVVFALAVILTAALGFLGVGLPPPTPEWGSMIATGASDAALGRWWSALFPTIALMLSVGAVSFSLHAVLRRLHH